DSGVPAAVQFEFELSGLLLSRQIGSSITRFVEGVEVHEQSVLSTSLALPLEVSIVTMVLEPSLLCPCDVASMLKPFSPLVAVTGGLPGLDKTVPVARPLANIYVVLSDPA